MTGSEAQRQRSARLLSTILAVEALVALGGAAIAMTLGGAEGRAALAAAAAFLALALLAAASGVLEWRRAELAERFALATAILACPLTIAAILAGWWLYAPAIGIATLGTFLALAYRFSVRNEARHHEIGFSA